MMETQVELNQQVLEMMIALREMVIMLQERVDKQRLDIGRLEAQMQSLVNRTGSGVHGVQR